MPDTGDCAQNGGTEIMAVHKNEAVRDKLVYAFYSEKLCGEFVRIVELQRLNAGEF